MTATLHLIIRPPYPSRDPPLTTHAAILTTDVSAQYRLTVFYKKTLDEVINEGVQRFAEWCSEIRRRKPIVRGNQ